MLYRPIQKPEEPKYLTKLVEALAAIGFRRSGGAARRRNARDERMPHRFVHGGALIHAARTASAPDCHSAALHGNRWPAMLAHPIGNHMSDKINEFILSLESDKSIIVSKLRDLASGLSNTSKEDIKWNALCFFKGERAFVGIMPYKKYVSVIFDKGSQLSDPNKILEGKGKQMRHIKIYQEQDIKDKNVESFIKESYQLDWGEKMKTNELSTCFCTNDVDACRDFYSQHFAAKAIFDCGWYVNLRIGEDGPTVQFMQPQEGMPTFHGAGVMLLASALF